VTERAARRSLLVVLALLVLWGAAPGTGPFLRSVAASAGQLYRYRNASRENRALSLLGEPWRLVHEAANGTAPDARIVIPEGAAFDPLSNKTWCAYYLHPRTLLYPGELAAGGAGADVVVAWRGSATGLPGVPIDAPDSGVWRMARASGHIDSTGAPR
jgi:hypothetical protein